MPNMGYIEITRVPFTEKSCTYWESSCNKDIVILKYSYLKWCLVVAKVQTQTLFYISKMKEEKQRG